METLAQISAALTSTARAIPNLIYLTDEERAELYKALKSAVIVIERLKDSTESDGARKYATKLFAARAHLIEKAIAIDTARRKQKQRADYMQPPLFAHAEPRAG